MTYDQVGMKCSRFTAFALILLTSLSPSCTRQQQPAQVDAPRLTSLVRMQDVVFYSAALGHNMQYRVLMPNSLALGETLPAVYLLHGGGGGFRDWSNYSNVAKFTESRLLLIMPEGNSSYYTNSAEKPQDRYEDYIVQDLIRDVEKRFPARSDRSKRAIIGVSMGGFGAVKISLRHPDLFIFAGALSAAIDVPRRQFSVKRMRQWLGHKSIFGPPGSSTRRENDPFWLIQSVNPKTAPYLFLSCGEQEGLLPSNREFAASLSRRGFLHEFHTVSGGHNWNQWNAWLPALFASLKEHISSER